MYAVFSRIIILIIITILRQACPTFFDRISTFQAANLPRSPPLLHVHARAHTPGHVIAITNWKIKLHTRVSEKEITAYLCRRPWHTEAVTHSCSVISVETSRSTLAWTVLKCVSWRPTFLSFDKAVGELQIKQGLNENKQTNRNDTSRLWSRASIVGCCPLTTSCDTGHVPSYVQGDRLF